MKKILIFVGLVMLAFSCKSKKEEITTPVESTSSENNEISDLPVLTKRWETDTVTLKTPESVVFDQKMGTYYVSCIGAVPPDAKDKDGYIAKVDQQGKIMNGKWITGLNGPKGMVIKGDTLYVTDITEIVLINIASSKIIKRIPVKGAQFLNDIDIDASGILYVSDSNTNTLHSYDGKTVKTMLNAEVLGGPNGIYNESDRLVMASFGKGQVYTVSKSDNKIEIKTDSLPGGDGVEAFRDGYLVSNWNGELYYINKEWKKNLLLDTKANKLNAADIEFVPSQNLLVIPTFFGNRVTAYDVK